ncbi:ATPase associated with various cellular activities AAA_5 [Paraglaciecola mesophila KMM 241]|uniref:ATPase associated with various cellular activities AAA_5 n=1 Tax=Paraglaciecola mesophila KMM 241 TaxID=1128912 RepID=K6YYL4_9ALTE|nr:AAA family ATPase [Paraglaciecola mesophila]GAC23272.1 ATPase associated with various cellular activities AAA_5 [Paraglaciecola mesophila KMM 241]
MTRFSQAQFETLKKYAGIKKDNANDQHLVAVKLLKDAYELTQIWADKVRQKRFPQGEIKLRKSPINQAGNFAEYTWAKIYPTSDSRKELAHTVGIYTEGFTVKIDTVNVDNALRKRYENVRGDYSDSPIVSSISIEDGLAMTMDQLVDWSIKKIAEFSPTYDEVSKEIGLSPVHVSHSKVPEDPQDDYQKSKLSMSLNQIFYGPPGTGKTFHTIEAAVIAAEPNFQANSRGELKAKYDELVAEERIRFVTFHQSYGYEEFVEGLRANSEEGVISYDVEPGIFKQICTDASKNIAKSMQLNSKTDFSVCWDKFLNEFDEEGVKIQTKKSSFMVTEITDKTIHFEKTQGTSQHSLAIKTLRGVFDGSKVIKGGLNVYYQPLVEHLKQFSKKDTLVPEPLKNFVLIIDEINRGNISKIFGELITLIEDSKRAHPTNTEALEVVLPNSGDSFSVPSNLYLIGTMNTADRSLAMMDTALRRRFDFVEMMPKPHLFDGILVEGISITKLLFTMNRRIEALYDREHTLGHAFFVPVMLAFESGDEQRAFEELKSVFTNKVIPLLEEYFFDDWNKIRLVLGDNQKPEHLQFVTQDEVPYQELFGDNHGLDTYEQAQITYSLVSYLEQDTVWDKAAAYQAIYPSDNV